MTIPGARRFSDAGEFAIDARDQNAFHFFLDVVFFAQVVGQIGEIEAKRFLDDRLCVRRRILLGVERSLLFLVLKAAELDGLLFFLAFANDDDFHVLADRRIGNDLWQVAHFLDVFAVEFDDDVAWLNAGGFGRAFFVDAGNQRAARRLDAQAFGDLIADLLDASRRASRDALP